MDSEISFPCGTGVLKARIPEKNIVAVLGKKEMPGLKDEYAAIKSSLNKPIGHAPLRDSLRKTDKVVVIVTDNTRPCPDDRIAPPLLDALEEILPRENITIIIALGLHPPLDKEQMIAKLGRRIVENYRVINHDVNNCVNIGITTRGTPVDINKLVIEADFRISTGFIEPHLFAGFSGGRKSIAPGVFSVRSAYHNHGYRMVDHPLAKPGVLRGNPVHEDMVEQARMAKLDFIVNVLLNQKRQITHVFAGDAIEAHEKGCDIARDIVGVKVPHKVDITVTTNSGAPLDLDFYQSVKGIDTASYITRDGGIIISVAACNTGVGPTEFWDLHKSAKSRMEILRKIRRLEPIGVQWQNQILARIQLKNEVYLVSQLPDSVARDMMVSPFPTIETALAKAFAVLGDKAEIAVIPEGPLVLPILG